MARLANCLVTLRDQINAQWPNRSKASDGWIGDEAHQGRTSDHNPGADDVVEAIDVTHDPAGGFDSYAFAELLRTKRDRRIEYVISNRRIFYADGAMPWQWQVYRGENAHSVHVHISCQPAPTTYDDASAWDIESVPERPGVHRGITATWFGGPTDNMSGAVTAYGNLIASNWWERPGVALPARINDRPLPSVRVTYEGKFVVCPVIDVGPWNTKDPYWASGTRPQAESGIDMSGRRTNLAGIDLTPAAANAIGLPGKGLVDWEFIKETEMAESDDLLIIEIRGLRAELASLPAAIVSAMKGEAVTPKPTESVPEPTPTPTTPTTPAPVLEKPGVGVGILGMLLSAVLQWSGGIDATQTGSWGQLLPIIAAGVTAAGATGMFGAFGPILTSLLSAFTKTDTKK